MSEFIPSIGLEVHVQLKTRTKMFCACPAHTEGEPNTTVCPVCLGLPGALPVMNREAIRKTVKVGLMIGSEISLRSTFDRKNYFYPDMSKDYQISQNVRPLCLGGGVTIQPGQRIALGNHPAPRPARGDEQDFGWTVLVGAAESIGKNGYLTHLFGSAGSADRPVPQRKIANR